ncbi:coiled-coil domain-containing protein 170-like isoform X1 [Cavia porcellus]|uniref:coiled-coil domain-containing protein 170-like isoform X1 n=2 Tax=Cavia porcellus TaxID=10141 RepID=UPI002FDF1D9E
MNFTKAADPVHPSFAGLLMKNKNLLAELRTLQRKLFREETSLQETKTDLARYKEQQSFQIMSLRDDVKSLQELITALARIKSLKNSNIQSLERGNWNLAKRVTELENLLRLHLAEREKAEQKAGFPANNLPHMSRLPPTNLKGQEDSLDIILAKEKDKAFLAGNFERDIIHPEGPNNGQKFWDKSQQDVFLKEKPTAELDGPPHSCSPEIKTARSQYQDLSQPTAILSDSGGPIPATEDAVKERIQEIGANEQSWKSRIEGLEQKIQKLTPRRGQLYQMCEEPTRESPHIGENSREPNRPSKCLGGHVAVDDSFQGKVDSDRKKLISAEEISTMQNFLTDKHNKFKRLDMLLNIQQNLQIATTLRLEDKIQKLQEQLSDLKLSNKTMKSQLIRVNILKDKTVESLKKSLTKVKTVKEKAVTKIDNLKTIADSAEQEARPQKERARNTLNGVTPQLSPAKNTLEEASRKEPELLGFRDNIMKMLGFNMKTADKEIINQLKLIIQVYEIANRSKMASACENGKGSE